MSPRKPIFTSENLHRFMLRLDISSQSRPLASGFDLAMAGAALTALLEFIDSLDLRAAPQPRQRRLIAAVQGARGATVCFRRGLHNSWVSDTLSSSGKSQRETFDEMRHAHVEAVNFG